MSNKKYADMYDLIDLIQLQDATDVAEYFKDKSTEEFVEWVKNSDIEKPLVDRFLKDPAKYMYPVLLEISTILRNRGELK